MSTHFFPRISENAYASFRPLVPELPEKHSGFEFQIGSKIANHQSQSPINDHQMVDVTLDELKDELAREGRKTGSIGDIQRIARRKGTP